MNKETARLVFVVTFAVCLFNAGREVRRAFDPGQHFPLICFFLATLGAGVAGMTLGYFMQLRETE